MRGGRHRRRRGARPNLQPNPPPCSQGTDQTAITTVTICFTYYTLRIESLMPFSSLLFKVVTTKRSVNAPNVNRSDLNSFLMKRRHSLLDRVSYSVVLQSFSSFFLFKLFLSHCTKTY